jgi:CRISPR type III-A-associated protein Csm2
MTDDRRTYSNRPGNQPYGGRNQPGQSSPQTCNEVWPSYLSGGYFDSAGNLRRDYITRERMEPFVKKMSEVRPNLTQSQVRRFFQHCRALEARLRSRQAKWPELEAEFCKIDAVAADAAGKSPAKIPGLFHDFIRRNVAAVHSEKEFLHGFLPHFEAFVGFGSRHIK